MVTRDVTDIIRRIIAEETRYHKRYIGKVVSNADPDNEAKVQVNLPELGFDGTGNAMWAYPHKELIDIPAIGVFVEVWFMGGDVRSPVYGSIIREMQGMASKVWDKKTSSVVLHESKDGSASITYDGNGYTFVSSSTIKVNGNLTIDP